MYNSMVVMAQWFQYRFSNNFILALCCKLSTVDLATTPLLSVFWTHWELHGLDLLHRSGVQHPWLKTLGYQGLHQRKPWTLGIAHFRPSTLQHIPWFPLLLPWMLSRLPHSKLCGVGLPTALQCSQVPQAMGSSSTADHTMLHTAPSSGARKERDPEDPGCFWEILAKGTQETHIPC